MVRYGRVLKLAVTAGLLLAASVASASIMEPALSITASNDNGTASLQVPLSAFTYTAATGEYAYDQWAPVNLTDGANYVARLTGLHIFIVDDPAMNARIIMNFGVQAGDSLTSFNVAPGTVSFPEIPADATEAVMGWTFTLAESTADADNVVWLRGTQTGAPIYRTEYNSGTEFHNSTWELGGTGNGAVYTNFDNVPAVGFEDVPVAVSQMNASLGFTLTQLDNAEIQTSYVFNVPEPAAFSLLILGVAALVRRR